MEACGQWLIRDPKAQRGHWRELMPGAKELRLELGCGKGRFTCQTAAADPDVLFIAVERVPDAMVMAMEKARSLASDQRVFRGRRRGGPAGIFRPR
ncbi:MAG: hypothetical protein ACLUNZ_00350 [Evtepia sp.]